VDAEPIALVLQEREVIIASVRTASAVPCPSAAMQTANVEMTVSVQLERASARQRRRSLEDAA